VKSFLLFLWSYRVFRYLVFLNLIVNFYAIFEVVKETENANYQVALFCGNEDSPTRKTTNSPVQQSLANANVSSVGSSLKGSNENTESVFVIAPVVQIHTLISQHVISREVHSRVKSRAPPVSC
jgi:hypothetical protein